MKRDVPATRFKIVDFHEEQSPLSESPDKALVPLNSSAAAGSASSSTLQRFGQRSRTEQGGASSSSFDPNASSNATQCIQHNAQQNLLQQHHSVHNTIDPKSLEELVASLCSCTSRSHCFSDEGPDGEQDATARVRLCLEVVSGPARRRD